MRVVAPAAALLVIGREKYSELLAPPGISVRQDGGLFYWCKDHLVAQTTEAKDASLRRARGFASGLGAGAPAGQALVPVRINGVPATLLLALSAGPGATRLAQGERRVRR